MHLTPRVLNIQNYVHPGNPKFEMSQLTALTRCGSTAGGKETRSWRVVAVDPSNGCAGGEYLIRGLFGAEGYDVKLSDANNVWEERLDAQHIRERLKVTCSECVPSW